MSRSEEFAATQEDGMIVIYCDQCGEEYDAVACRWRCPLCGWKGHCCEGEPQQGEPAGETPPERFI